MKKLFTLAVCAAMMFSCATNEDIIPDSGKLPINISVNQHTRANDTTYENGDDVGIYIVNYDGSTAGSLAASGNQADNVKFTFNNNTWTPEETIYWKNASTAADFYAYYPYSSSPSISAHPFAVQANQSTENAFWASDFLWGKATNVSPTPNPVTIQTNHSLSRILIDIKPGNGFTESSWAAATKSVKICDVKTAATINLATGVATATGDNGEITPLATTETGTTLSYKAMIIPQVVADNSKLVVVTIDGTDYVYRKGYTFNPNTQHEFSVTVNKTEGNANIIIGEWAIDCSTNEGNAVEEGNGESGVIDLSSNGTANCYMAQTNGQYSFNASVKGNSTSSIGTPTSAIVVWETFNNAIALNVGEVVKNVFLTNGIITFETTNNEGNALIAATDESGTILWSWHIWVTNYMPENDYDTYVGFEDLKVMDRNLGALSNRGNADAAGMVYQWGRKEPFGGSDMILTAEQQTATTSKEVGTDEYATTHPTTYILALSQGKDWRYSSNSLAWSSTKSQLDPCPPGWKVPEKGLYVNLELGIFDYENKGMMFKDANGNYNIYMPAQGYLSDSETYSAGWWQVDYEGRYWTTTTLDIYSYYFGFKANSMISPSDPIDCSRANGHAIRCVQDK